MSQKEPRIEVFTREEHGWHYEDVRSGGAVALGGLDVTLRVDDVYARALEP